MTRIVTVNIPDRDRKLMSCLAADLAPAMIVTPFSSEQDVIDSLTGSAPPALILTGFIPSPEGKKGFLPALRSSSRGQMVPVIVLTEKEDADLRLVALKEGATEVLASTITTEEFLLRVRNMLQLTVFRRHPNQRAVVLERELADSYRAREEARRMDRKNLLQVIDTVPTMMGATDPEGRVVFINRCMAEVLGSTPAQLTGTMVPGLRNVARKDSCHSENHPGNCGVLKECCHGRYEETIHDAHGRERILLTSATPLDTGRGEVPLTLRTSLDITELKNAQKRLHALAYRDQLTGGPNRLKVEQVVNHFMGSGRLRPAFALFMLDLDRFRSVNDTLGHSVGDLLLKCVAARLERILPHASVVGRLGGDEFAIVIRLKKADQEVEACLHAAAIRDCFVQPFILGTGGAFPSAAVSDEDSKVITTASIGIVVSSDEQVTFDRLLRRADIAMYKAKSAGGSGYELFRPEMETAEEAALRIELDLHKAVRNNELMLYYQPQIDLRTGHIIGVEALLRWMRPDGTMQAPVTFLPVAEETGLIVPITQWVLEEACNQLAAWSEQNFSVRMAVNMSGVLFRRANIRSMVLNVIERTGINPADLELELTESVLIDNAEMANRELADLRRLGIAVAVDDFGTGYASMSYLSRLIIDRIKIDRSFISEIPNSTSNQMIVRSMIMLCRNMGIKIIAEGIETPEEARWLAAHHCDEGQGFYFGRPQPAEKITELLRLAASSPHGDTYATGMPHISLWTPAAHAVDVAVSDQAD